MVAHDWLLCLWNHPIVTSGHISCLITHFPASTCFVIWLIASLFLNVISLFQGRFLFKFICFLISALYSCCIVYTVIKRLVQRKNASPHEDMRTEMIELLHSYQTEMEDTITCIYVCRCVGFKKFRIVCETLMALCSGAGGEGRWMGKMSGRPVVEQPDAHSNLTGSSSTGESPV